MDFSSLRETQPHEYIIRFLFGGVCTVSAGLIAKRYGPGIGGLFLAFPAIFPASASLIENHEKKRKAEHGFNGTIRGRLAASIDASGASLGCIGLAMFALTLRMALPGHVALHTLVAASVVWITISSLLWSISRHRIFHKRKKQTDQRRQDV
ncbi:DUF3147 family protein [Tunturiibacter gelidoferens]|uniref:DUF3147 family protein n=2 Tax=Tunturiibacter TaxID=3154218 RepID=A0A7Y9T2Y6_9BACT|nr:DUF3147 family protein [Edaphobacter lichenicola]MBB5339028.1 hypothetical protein [Edaphobacter lichenicola]NYF51746.1 hypothetical protein [Edaphobacter lichenicola]